MSETEKPREMTLPAIRKRFDYGFWDSADCLWLYTKAAQHAELLEALIALEEVVADLRAGRTWSRDYVGVVQAQARAKTAIRRAKGE